MKRTSLTPDTRLVLDKQVGTTSLTPDSVVAIAASRLADLHEAIHGTRPERSKGPPHEDLLKWLPVLAEIERYLPRTVQPRSAPSPYLRVIKSAAISGATSFVLGLMAGLVWFLC